MRQILTSVCLFLVSCAGLIYAQEQRYDVRTFPPLHCLKVDEPFDVPEAGKRLMPYVCERGIIVLVPVPIAPRTPPKDPVPLPRSEKELEL